MQLTGVAFRPADRRVDNAELIATALDRSPDLGDDRDRERVGRALERLLAYTGARERHWTQTPAAVPGWITATLDRALDRAGRARSDVDVLISTSVDRSVLEPAHAYTLTALAGMHHCQCFDVTDGCNGWVRATQLAQGLFATDAATCVAIVSTELNMMPDGAFLSGLLQLEPGSLRRSFPPLTLGDGVAVTILEPGGDDWELHFASRSDLLELCYAPLPESSRYRPADARATWRDDTLFVVDGAGLFRAAEEAVPKLLSNVGIDVDAADDVLVHGATSRHWGAGARGYALTDRLRNAFPRYGNVVSASIPAALATAVPRHDGVRQVVAIGASAGMSFAVARFTVDPSALASPSG